MNPPLTNVYIDMLLELVSKNIALAQYISSLTHIAKRHKLTRETSEGTAIARSFIHNVNISG